MPHIVAVARLRADRAFPSGAGRDGMQPRDDSAIPGAPQAGSAVKSGQRAATVPRLAFHENPILLNSGNFSDGSAVTVTAAMFFRD